MAFIDDQKKKLAAAGQPVTSAAPALASAAPAQTAAPAATAAAPKSNGYTNLQDYLRLNQPQAQAMAQKVGGAIQQEGTQFQNALNSAGQQFTQQVLNGSPFGIQHQGRGTMDRPQPTSTAQLQKLGQTTYSGPTGLGSDTIANLQAQGAKVGADAAQLGSYNGLQAYLQQQNPGASYTAGDSRLDAFLTGAAGRGTFDSLAKQYGETGGAVDKAAQNASDFAKNAADYTNSTAAGYAQQGAQQAQEEGEQRKKAERAAKQAQGSAVGGIKRGYRGLDPLLGGG